MTGAQMRLADPARFIEIDGAAAPHGAECYFAAADDGARLRVAFFPHREDNARVAVVLGGWSEFIEKYFETARDLHKRGFHVAMMDWRGQGHSSRVDRWSGYFDRLTDDLGAFLEGPVRERFGETDALITHSMGGMPALQLLARGARPVRRAVLSAPMSRLSKGALEPVSRWAAAAASALGFADRPVANVSRDAQVFDGNMFTTDRARHERFRALKAAAPETALSSPTLGWVAAATRASAKIHAPRYFSDLRTPTLIVSAGEERRIDGEDHARLADRSPYLAHAIVDGALHEILMEKDHYRDEFWRLFDRFIAGEGPVADAPY